LLVIGTAQVEASIIVWEISTNLMLSKFILPWVCVVQNIKIAHDDRHILVVGLTKDYIQAVILINYVTK